MKHALLVVLETGEIWQKVAEYVARACAGAAGSSAKVVLFAVLPALPPWIESGAPEDAAAQREKFETETGEQLTRQVAEVRRFLVAHGVSDAIIAKEIAEESARIVPGILASARRHGCDTIVMARHHKSMVREFFAGDPEEKLLRHPIGFTVWLVE